MRYTHPPRAQRCAHAILASDTNCWMDDSYVLSPGMIDTTVQSATATTEGFLNSAMARCHDEIETCNQNLREHYRQLPNASPATREQLLSYLHRDLQTVREAKVRLMIYKRAIADIRKGRCKKKTIQNTNCDNANLSFVDYCGDHR